MYISPNLAIYQSFKDVKNENPFGRYTWYFDEERLEVKDILLHPRFIVLGEPGYGKTELLKKIVEEANTQNLNAVMVDLKSLDLNMCIGDNISKIIKRPDSIKTNKFRLENSENVIVCLDALDEVSASNLSIVIDKIKDFLTDFVNIKIYLSCRKLYYESYQNSFNGYNCKILIIECFYREQIVKYLKENNLTESVINIVLKNFIQNSGLISVIQTPRYLSLLVKYIAEMGDNEIAKLTRCQLFEYFVYSKLNKEKGILANVDIDLIKRVLETLALTMSIYQTRKITKDELMTFFDDIKNDLKINILSQISIDEFLQKSILKNNIDSIEFDNSEFQEYLAAKELSRFKKLQQSVFDLSVNSQIREVYPSWFNVLSYLIEININLLDDILSFGISGQKTIIEGYFKLITSVNVNLLPEITRNKIFKVVFEYYQTNKLSLHGHFCANLSYYYTENNLHILKKYFNKPDKSKYEEHILIRNVFTVLYEILYRGYLDSEEIKYWNDKFISIIEDKTVSIELKDQILFITKHLKDKRVLSLMQEILYRVEKDSLHSLIIYASNIDVNDPITLSFIIEGIRNKTGISIYQIKEFTSLVAIKSFFRQLNSDLQLISNFHELSNRNVEKYLAEIVNNLENVMDSELSELLKDFIFKSYSNKIHLQRHSKLIKVLADLMSRIDGNFLFELIDKFSKVKGDFFEFQLPEIFSYCLNKELIPKFIAEIGAKLQNPPWLAFDTLYSLKYSKDERFIELFEVGRSFFEKDYEEADKNAQKHKSRDEEIKKEEYKTFNAILNVSHEKNYYPNLFSIYATQHEDIEQFITPEEKEKLKKLNEIFLVTHNPLNSGLVLNADGRYSVYTYIFDYGYALKTALLLGVNTKKYRQNIINYIPFAYSDDLDAIFDLVGNISSIELEPVLNVYRKKTDDLWKFMPENLIHIVEKYNINAESILEDFVLSNDFRSSSNFYRIKALNLVDSFKNSRAYLIDLFNNKKNIESEKFIAFGANKILISKYQDINAIKWRISEIKKRVFKFTKSTAGRVSANESELRDKNFATPLMEVKDYRFIQLYLVLFEDSFKIQQRDKDYWNYANYIREIVLAYFLNLREYRKFEYFEIIESAFKKFYGIDHYGYILSTISNLKNQYIDYIGKPTNVSECIQKYNKIKKSQYIEINNVRELLDKINSLIKTDLNKWIQGEAIKILDAIKSKERPSETELQKLIKMQFENILLRNGFRSEEINIYREAQALNDKRPDYILAYGFVQPIAIELKLSDHDDLNKKDLSTAESYKSLIFYLNNFNVEYAIFLIYDNQNLEKNKWSKFLKKIEVEYSKIANVVVTGLPQ